MSHPMVRMAWKAAVLVAANAALAWGVLAAHDATTHYERWQTDSLLEVMPSNTHFDGVILGTSRAYLLSRYRRNHEKLEDTLGMRLFNLALPVAGGIRPERLYLEQFLAQGNSAGQLLYFLEPFVFFSAGPNDNHKFVYFEPLRPRFLARLIADGYPWRRIFTYIRSKFTWEWFNQKPEPLISHPGKLNAPIDPERVRRRIATLYLDGEQESIFLRYAPELRRVFEIAKKHDMETHVIFPSTLLGEEPGTERLKRELDELSAEFSFTVTVSTGAIPNPELYYDLDHLNTAGVGTYAQSFLRPMLERTNR